MHRARKYADSKDIAIHFQSRLGFGSDGYVWKSSRGSAIKACMRPDSYAIERSCYQRLKEAGVTSLKGLNVPELIDFDDALMVIEMGIVDEPYFLDFGKAYLDHPPDYWSDPQMVQNFHAEKSRLFGKNWKVVDSAMSWLRKLGIYYVDPRPGNVSFGDEDDDDDLADFDL